MKIPIISHYWLWFKEYIYRIISRGRLINHNFSIISNDCWGGGVYEDLNIQYKTPTVGLFFYPEDYIEFVRHFKELIYKDLNFVTQSKYQECNVKREKNGLTYPIGIVGGVEIHFLHYKSQQDAMEKWIRRRERINFDNLFFKFSDRENCSYKHIKEFCMLPISNKVVFTSKPLDLIDVVFLPKYEGQPTIGDIYTDRWAYRSQFDVVKWLNKDKK